MWFHRTAEIFYRVFNRRELKITQFNSPELQHQLGEEMLKRYVSTTMRQRMVNAIFEDEQNLPMSYDVVTDTFQIRVVITSKEAIGNALALAYFAGAQDERDGTLCQ